MSVHKVWKLIPPSTLASQLAHEAGLTPLQAQLLLNRGISDPLQAESFLCPRLAGIADPMLLKDMDDALSVILKAIDNKEKITIYGDYDADGLTATALLINFFSSLGIPVSYYIPNRLEEGYSLNNEAIKKISKNGTRLIITVDCGISNEKEIVFARSLGINVVVTDHHQIPEGFQANCPVINSHQPDCRFPFKHLAGVGMAFFLAVAIRAALRERGWFGTGSIPDLKEYLDLVALGTVADRVPLLGHNRILVNSGMETISVSRWPGINAMKESACVASSKITTEDLAFRLAPRLNAPGRLGDPGIGIQILTIKDPVLAKDLALRLNEANSQRQSVERNILGQIEDIIRAEKGIGDRRVLIFGAEGWHKGVLGIVASRLVDLYHRPSLVFGIQDDLAVGSGRSIDGFNLYLALTQLGHLFEKFGGHAHAAGFTLKAANLDILRSELELIARETLDDEDLLPVIDVDAEISFQDITPEMVGQIKALSPFGEGNPEPLFLARSLEVLGSWIVGENHLKLRLRQGRETHEAIGFGFADKYPLDGNIINVVFTPEINQWQGYERVQLRVVDIQT